MDGKKNEVDFGIGFSGYLKIKPYLFGGKRE